MDVLAEMKPGAVALGPSSLTLKYSAWIEPALRGHALEIVELLTPSAQRGNNHANSLMQEVCDQADAAGKVLVLMPEQFDTGGPTTEQLANWYMRKFNFTPIQTEPKIILARMPAAAAAKWNGQ